MTDTSSVFGTGPTSSQEPTDKFDKAELVRGWRAYEARRPRVVPILKFACKTDMGQVRENNEDKFDYYEPEEPAILSARGSLFAVADGIGGAQAGQIASEMMLKQLTLSYYDSGATELKTALSDAIIQANDRIYHLAQAIPERSGMGTTLTAVIFVEDRVVIAQVGDSRAYLIRDDVVSQVSQDHSWVEESVRAGVMTRAEAENSPFKNVITRSVGAASSVMPDFYEEVARTGDIWVLCSDGLSGYVSADEIKRIVSTCPPSEAARQFIELANSRGGRDNITVVVVSIRDLCPFDGEVLERAEVSEPTKQPSTPVTPEPSTPEKLGRSRSVWRKLFGI